MARGSLRSRLAPLATHLLVLFVNQAVQVAEEQGVGRGKLPKNDCSLSNDEQEELSSGWQIRRQAGFQQRHHCCF